MSAKAGPEDSDGVFDPADDILNPGGGARDERGAQRVEGLLAGGDGGAGSSR